MFVIVSSTNKRSVPDFGVVIMTVTTEVMLDYLAQGLSYFFI